MASSAAWAIGRGAVQASDDGCWPIATNNHTGCPIRITYESTATESSNPQSLETWWNMCPFPLLQMSIFFFTKMYQDVLYQLASSRRPGICNQEAAQSWEQTGARCCWSHTPGWRFWFLSSWRCPWPSVQRGRWTHGLEPKWITISEYMGCIRKMQAGWAQEMYHTAFQTLVNSMTENISLYKTGSYVPALPQVFLVWFGFVVSKTGKKMVVSLLAELRSSTSIS